MKYHLFIDGIKIEHVASVRLNRDGTVEVLDGGAVYYSRAIIEKGNDGLDVNIRLSSVDRMPDPDPAIKPARGVGPSEYKDLAEGA